jgi:hypothetical protein
MTRRKKKANHQTAAVMEMTTMKTTKGQAMVNLEGMAANQVEGWANLAEMRAGTNLRMTQNQNPRHNRERTPFKEVRDNILSDKICIGTLEDYFNLTTKGNYRRH